MKKVNEIKMNKEVVFSVVATMLAQNTRFASKSKPNDIGIIWDTVESLMKEVLSKKQQNLPFDVKLINLVNEAQNDKDTLLMVAAYLLIFVYNDITDINALPAMEEVL